MTTLIKKLQSQVDANAGAPALLTTARMLVAELLTTRSAITESNYEKVAVVLPCVVNILEEQTDNGDEESSEKKVIEVLQVDEKEIEEELEQIKRKAEVVNALTAHAKPDFHYDPIEDLPTLAHQTPLKRNQTPEDVSFDYPESLNDRLKEVKIELSEKLNESPIKDLRKAIGVNDRYVFVNELFRGDEAMYERSIKTIQNFSIYAEAEYWIKRELKIKIGWHDSHPVVKQFDQLIKRRFA